LVLSFGRRRRDALWVAQIVLHPALYAVYLRKLIVVDIASGVAVVATLGVVVGVSSARPGSYKLKGSEELAADSAAFRLK
jgi:hypothetical protein